ETFLEYPFRSPCGKEMNFIKCADRPFVFEDLKRDDKGQWTLVFGGGELAMPFRPETLRISLSTGRLYHDVQTKKVAAGTSEGIALVKSQLAVELGKHIDVHDFPDDDDVPNDVASLVIGTFRIDKRLGNMAATATSSGATSPHHPRILGAKYPVDEEDDEFSVRDGGVKASTVSKGNRVAQFIVATAVFCVLYQVATSPAGPSAVPTASSRAPAPSPLVGDGGAAGYRKEDSRQLSSSECTCFLACLGLFGLLQRTKKKSKTEQKQAEMDEEEFVALQRALLLSRQEVRRLKSKGKSSIAAIDCAEGIRRKRMTDLPREVLNDLLLFLPARDLATCPMVSKAWDFHVGDAAESLWRLVFQRDFGEPGDRFARVFPIECWRQFYFQHHLSRPVELARLLGLTADRQCVAIAGQVYDITGFLDLHPGGPHVIGDAVGTDATDIWDQFRHSLEAKASMEQFLVADHVLARPASRRLRGNLAQVVSRWHKISWCLTHSHCFGRMAPQFTNVMIRFHSRGVARRKQASASFATS
ncbi:hypothetical protein BBJ28_00009853, partial [Nothophytophthora sp. Chile5]